MRITCAPFGLIHAGNVITGQALGETIAQMTLDVRALTVPIAAHGLWDFSLYLHASAA